MWMQSVGEKRMNNGIASALLSSAKDVLREFSCDGIKASTMIRLRDAILEAEKSGQIDDLD